ncbi:MAG: TauD/TfdA family dioxygenase [Acidobacteriota bacterium]|nr:TauD/TfdA family dioxygenase [Acidobacteriota bacterium]
MTKQWNIPAAWRGAELFSRPDWTHKLTKSEIDEIDAALRSVEVAGLSLPQITPATFPLPHFKTFLEETADSLEHGSGACYLRGFPVWRYNEAQLKIIFWGISRHLGIPISQSATGERIFSVRDEGFKMDNPKARGPNTSKGLSFHTDRCDVIGFMCVKQAKSGGENYLVSSVTLFNEIAKRRPDMLAALQEPYTYLRHTVDTGNSLPYCLQPVFAERDGCFAANLLRVLIDRAQKTEGVPKLSAKQVEALDYLESVAAEPELHVSFRQEPGDLLFVNNWVLFHSRSQFEDHPEPESRRHLLRVWLSMPNSRAVPESFRGNYGQVGAGAVRGGMKPKERRLR